MTDLIFEEYKCAALSTGHLTVSDNEQLTFLAAQSDNFRVAKRDTGFFIKLMHREPEEIEACNTRDELAALFFGDTEGLSDSFKAIIVAAGQGGFELIEFDSVAGIVDGLPVFDW